MLSWFTVGSLTNQFYLDVETVDGHQFFNLKSQKHFKVYKSFGIVNKVPKEAGTGFKYELDEVEVFRYLKEVRNKRVNELLNAASVQDDPMADEVDLSKEVEHVRHCS